MSDNYHYLEQQRDLCYNYYIGSIHVSKKATLPHGNIIDPQYTLYLWRMHMQILFFLFFITIFGMVIFGFINGIAQWNRNNHSPRLSVDVTVVAKRTYVSHHNHNHDGHIHTTSSTSYYVTFQVASGDRMEFLVPWGDYGMIVEGDRGVLSFRGTRYLGFDRQA